VVTAGFDHAAAGTPRATWTDNDAWRRVPVWTPPGGPASLLVVAAHPDDESLGAAGAITRLAASGWRVEVVVATDGEGSHPDSPTLGPDALAARRRGEADAAMRLLGPGVRVHHLGLPDGALASREDEVVERLVDLIGENGADLTLLAPWREDPHPDHRAAGRAARQAAHRTDSQLLEYPVWAWHQLVPDDIPWERALRLELTDRERRHKADAIAAHTSQVLPLSDDPRDGAVVTADLLAHFSGAEEIYLATEPGPPPTPFEDLHTRLADPWQVDDSWYERRKRSVLLGALPDPSYATALEIGCSVGALTEDLAARCAHVTAVDVSAAAVARARHRLTGFDWITVERRTVPDELPDGPFDLVVLSEVGYFLSPRALTDTIAALQSTRRHGVVVACHWRHPVRGWPLDGAAVHRRLREAWGAPGVRHIERDFLLEVWPVMAP
jgi:LmbE family N-acetylglucosaminyl deacetylase